MRKDYVEFQDRSIPLAYFISFRSYGTWLHGDARLSMDRKNYNIFGTEKIPANAELYNNELSELKNAPFEFDCQSRSVIQNAIREVCDFRGYHLIALSVRTNHVHCVVSGNAKPELMMNSFKSYSTRRLREEVQLLKDMKVWSRHGSTRYLWTEEQIGSAVLYVVNEQGDELPNF